MVVAWCREILSAGYNNFGAHNHWTASILSLGTLVPHEFFKLKILVPIREKERSLKLSDSQHQNPSNSQQFDINTCYAPT